MGNFTFDRHGFPLTLVLTVRLTYNQQYQWRLAQDYVVPQDSAVHCHDMIAFSILIGS